MMASNSPPSTNQQNHETVCSEHKFETSTHESLTSPIVYGCKNKLFNKEEINLNLEEVKQTLLHLPVPGATSRQSKFYDEDQKIWISVFYSLSLLPDIDAEDSQGD